MERNEKLMDMGEEDNVRPSISGATVNGATERNLYIDHKDEKKLILKLDIHIAPIVMVLYLIAFLDRYSFIKDSGQTDRQIEYRLRQCSRVNEGYRSHWHSIQCRHQYILCELCSYRNSCGDSREESQIQSYDPCDCNGMGNCVSLHRVCTELWRIDSHKVTPWRYGRGFIPVSYSLLDELV